jgi:hypothetical protein
MDFLAPTERSTDADLLKRFNALTLFLFGRDVKTSTGLRRHFFLDQNRFSKSAGCLGPESDLLALQESI